MPYIRTQDAVSTPRNRRFLLSLALAGALSMALAACGGDGGSSSSNPVTIPTPTPTPGVPTPSPSPAPTPTPPPTSWAAGAAALYDSPPDLATCNTGVLKASVRADMLARVNALRALHRLPPVTYSDADNAQTDQSSLMMAANQQLSHTPPSNWLCYTSTGAAGAGSSNLIGGWGNGLPWSTEDDNLGGWMTEINSASIGHRRWILDPFLGKIAYGRVAQQSANGMRSDAATLKVFNFASEPPSPAASSVPPYVAYPYGDYPARYFDMTAFLSFSAVANTNNRFANGSISFANASVTVSNGSTNLTVTDIAQDNQGYGLPNNIQWHVAGLQPNVTYTVQISGVTNAPSTSYQYTFRIVP